jgi:hypothetical protein
MEEKVQAEENGFILFKEWLEETIKKPVKRFNFWVYFIVGIIGIGGIGIWASFFKQAAALPKTLFAILTFYLATAASSCMAFIFTETEKKFVRGFSIFSAFLLMVSAVFILIYSSYVFAVLASFYSLLLWWLSNANNPDLSDIGKPDAPVGGDINQQMNDTKGGYQI